MNWVQIHLLINHLPFAGLLFGALALGAGAWRRSRDLEVFGLLTLAVVGLMSCVVFQSGDSAVQASSDLADASVQAHRFWAQVSMIASTCLGTGALWALLYPKPPAEPPRWSVALVLLGALICVGLLVYAGHLGGVLRHAAALQ